MPKHGRPATAGRVAPSGLGTADDRMFRKQAAWILAAWIAVGYGGVTWAQDINLPPRPAHAPTGTDLAVRFKSATGLEPESAIVQEVLAGNIPGFLRRFCPVTVTNVIGGRTNVATLRVAPDYLAVGSDADYLLVPLSPVSAQLIASRLDCLLPTRKLVDAIYAAAGLKLSPRPIPPGPAMTTFAVFAQHNDLVRAQRSREAPLHPLGILTAGHKKDVVISHRLSETPGKVAIYGWHQTNGLPIQPLYLGHSAAWVDYSHGIRLVQQQMTVNGQPTTASQVLADENLNGLLSDEGPIVNPCYPTQMPAMPASPPSRTNAPLPSRVPRLSELKPAGQFGELTASFALAPEARITLNAPPLETFDLNKPVRLIFYVLPNGNTTEQTIGKKLEPGDDWHFDIQHIGAQTRLLRELVSNRTVVVAYLEAAMKSWPAWRKNHGDQAIPRILDAVKGIFAAYPLEIVLTGHSGGGSLTFGYLNTLEHLPADVQRIAFLDSNYAYDAAQGHHRKLAAWLNASPEHWLCVLAYHDAVALLDGKPFVSEQGGTWGRSHAMLADFSADFRFTSRTNAGLETWSALDGRVQFLLKQNPERKILHTVQVKRNGFLHAMVCGTTNEGRGYEYLGERAYNRFITDR